MGAEVAGYALKPEKGSHFESLGLNESIHHIEADIRDGEKLTSELKNFKPNFVFHLAAQALVRKSYRDPRETFETNVLGSLNLLEAVRETTEVSSLVYITSDKCYENKEWVWGYKETDSLGGVDPYSASKASAEILFSSYSRSFFKDRENFSMATARAGNVIGGGDWSEDRIIPDCVRAITRGNPITLRKPRSTRPWQHVLEPLSGYLLLGTKLAEDSTKWEGSWNFGPDTSEPITVQGVAQAMIDEFGRGSIEVVEDAAHLHEAGLLQLNCDKARNLLGWKPTWDAKKTITETANWYKRIDAGEAAIEVTRGQIKEYFGSHND
jgi:CDP-glucose 4,6-dehydratase